MLASPTDRPDPRQRVGIVYGTRPEAVKIAPLWQALNEHPHLRPVLISTGQHREMLAEIHAWFGMEPDVDLDLMTPGQGLAGLTGKVITAVDRTLAELSLAAVVVHGDTTTSMAGALAARYHQVPVVHLEAGLRTRDLSAPFPEELNRRLTGVMADLHLAPTARAEQHLLAEGVPARQVVVTGNTVIDALLHSVRRGCPVRDAAVSAALLRAERIVVATLHRRESHGEPLRQVALGLAELTRRVPGTIVVLPLHPNPAVRTSIGAVVEACREIVVCDPMPYPEFVSLLAVADLIVTDSGGIQEEAPSLDVPVLVTRVSTERPEAIEAGTARLVGTDADLLVRTAVELLDDPEVYNQIAATPNPFGDGRAAQRAVAAIADLVLGRAARTPPRAGALLGPGR